MNDSVTARRTAFVGFAAVVLLALAAASGPCAAAWWGDTVKGNGQIRTQTRAVSGFAGVALGLPAEVEVRQGPSEGVTIEADDNLLPLIETKVEDGVLEIRPLHRNQDLAPRKLRILVDMKQVRSLALGGSGTIHSTALRSPKLRLEIGGSGSIELAGVEAGELAARIGGSGKIGVAGKARNLSVAIGGSGDVVAEKLMADEVEVSIGGSGNARLWARTSLEASVAGSGDIRYWGDPQLTTSVVGSGRLRRLGPAPG